MTGGDFYTIIQLIASPGGGTLPVFRILCGRWSEPRRGKGDRIVNNKEMVVTPEGLKALEDELEDKMQRWVYLHELDERIRAQRPGG